MGPFISLSILRLRTILKCKWNLYGRCLLIEAILMNLTLLLMDKKDAQKHVTPLLLTTESLLSTWLSVSITTICGSES